MTDDQDYSLLDRLIHRFAFLSPLVQLTAADLESSVYGARFSTINIDKPIFITSLPRAGTTMLLAIFAGSPELATHSYRDMPFVLAPLLWDAMSKPFRKPARLRERAHGDGVPVGYDSPEAFEEVVWRTFWPEKFTRNFIELWQQDETAGEFAEFFATHMRKIIAVRSNGSCKKRYLSKNNANIARVGLLRRLFPECSIVIPFRQPVAQAKSLLRQHDRFVVRHGADPFSRRYMSDLGHFEFGELHRPIRFAGVNEVVRKYEANSLEYWMAYWIHAFRHVLRHRDGVLFVSYERLCKLGATGLQTLAGRLGLTSQLWDDAAAPVLREPRSYTEEASTADRDLVAQSYALYDQLLNMSVV